MPPRKPKIPNELDGWQIGDLLGQSPFGAVYYRRARWYQGRCQGRVAKEAF